MFDRLGHVICDQCAGPMKVEAVKTLTASFQVRFVCAQCERERLVDLKREAKREAAARRNVSSAAARGAVIKLRTP
jgi:transposase-like protein